jgi:hypothetical protein
MEPHLPPATWRQACARSFTRPKACRARVRTIASQAEIRNPGDGNLSNLAIAIRKGRYWVNVCRKRALRGILSREP